MYMTPRRTIPITRGGSSKIIRVSSGEPVTTVKTVETANPEVPPVFNDMQRNMESELERRRKDWEKEVERMQHDFFNLKTTPGGTTTTTTTSTPVAAVAAVAADEDEYDNVSRNVSVKVASPVRSPSTGVGLVEVTNSLTNFVDMPDGSRVYRLRYDVSEFDPNDVKVRAEGRKLFLSAWQEVDHGNGHKSTKQFNRQIDIPDKVDPDHLVATVNMDGYLNIEAPVAEDSPPPSIEVQQPQLSPPKYFSVVKKRSPPTSPNISTISSISRYTSSPQIVNVNDTRKLKMSVDIGAEFNPQDVTVKVIGRKIHVSAKHEETVAGRTSKREFSREFDIHEPLEESSVRAVLCHDGRLYIGASVEANRTHHEAMDSVLRDMPMDGKPVRIIII